jgi:hypothetical protein
MVGQATAIDAKSNDGLPASGNVKPLYVASYGFSLPVSWVGALTNPPGSSGSCFDSTTGPQLYSIEQSGGAGLNCALSFQF